MKWEVKKLGEVFDVRDGTHDSPKYQDDGYPLITSKNLKNNEIDFTKIKYISEEDYEQINKRSKVQKGDLLFAMIGTIGNPTVINIEPEFAIKNVALFKGNNRNSIKFLRYYLETRFVQKKMSSEARGTTQKFVGLKYLRDFPFPVLPIAEQKRIVEILDESFAGIERAEAIACQNLTNARELFDSYLNKIFTRQDKDWRSSPLGDVVNFLNGFAFKSQDTVPESNVQLIRMGNLYQNKLDLQRNPAFYPDNFKHEYSRYLLKQGDLIISLTGTVDKEDYGFTVEIPRHEGFLLLNQRIAKFIDFSPEISKEFLLYILRSKIFLKKLYASSRGVRQANLSTTEIRKIDISFPSLQKQEEAICCFRKIEQETQNLEGIYQRKLEALAELKQSILQKAFTGQLT